uniref:MADF domain-containing protein n=1 Tax=Anopheles dirus TaxID=7168 RepID=A0A182N3C0_9DIPT
MNRPLRRLEKYRQPKRSTVSMTLQTALRFIAMVKAKPCLWYRAHPLYKNRKENENAWESLADAMGHSVEELKDKWASLNSSFRGYRLRNAHNASSAMKIPRRQQMLAEKIISDVLFEAELGRLGTRHVWNVQKALRASSEMPDDTNT